MAENVWLSFQGRERVRERESLPSTTTIMLFIPCPQVLLMGKKIDPTELDFLLRYPTVLNVTSPVEFLSHGSWGGIKALSNMEQFRNLDKDIEVHVHDMYYT